MRDGVGGIDEDGDLQVLTQEQFVREHGVVGQIITRGAGKLVRSPESIGCSSFVILFYIGLVPFGIRRGDVICRVMRN